MVWLALLPVQTPLSWQIAGFILIRHPCCVFSPPLGLDYIPPLKYVSGLGCPGIILLCVAWVPEACLIQKELASFSLLPLWLLLKGRVVICLTIRCIHRFFRSWTGWIRIAFRFLNPLRCLIDGTEPGPGVWGLCKVKWNISPRASLILVNSLSMKIPTI